MSQCRQIYNSGSYQDCESSNNQINEVHSYNLSFYNMHAEI